MNPDPVQTSEPLAVKASGLRRHGLTIFKRHQKYVCRIRFRGKVHWLTLAETADKSFTEALRARRALHDGRFAAYREATTLRAPPQTTCAELFAAYRLFEGRDRPSEATREQNIHALESLARDVLGPTVALPALPLLRFSGDLVWRWKEHKRQLAGQAADDERAGQILRSANSRLRQARSLFSAQDDLRKFYQHHQITLPDTLAGFLQEPPFPDCSKREYHAPGDLIIAATFRAIEALAVPAALPESPGLALERLNLYKAIWLAIGFGLRKSEIAVARNGWFHNVAGTTFCRGDVLAKNRKFPEVRVQLGAWTKLAPLIEGQDPAAHVLNGNQYERQSNTFRRISEWMRRLGWQTTHHIHEFRAWAGCQIAMAPGGRGLLDAQVFLRHASFATTEQFYGHHLKIRLDEVQLTLPDLAPAPFTPVILRRIMTAH